LQNADKSPQFKPKITPAQVKEQIANDKKKLTKTQSENCAEKTLPPVEKKAKRKKAAQKEVKKEDKEAVTFPLAARINAYGFIFLKAKWLAALSWHVDMPLSIDKNLDGSVTVRKAS
jgi:hypothetical protein